MLFSGHPDRFLDRIGIGDQKWDRVLNDPYGRVRYLLVSTIRPADLSTANYNVPMRDSLLWVYEGMTEYLGNVLATRSGLKSQAAYRDILAVTAAQQDYRHRQSEILANPFGCLEAVHARHLGIQQDQSNGISPLRPLP